MEHFAGDEDIMARVRSVLVGDPVRASMIASAAPLILEPPAAIARLFEILRVISVTGVVREGRVDIVAHSLVRAWDGYQSKNDLERETFAAETLALVQRTPPLWGADPSYDLAVAFYPSPAARNAVGAIGLDGGPFDRAVPQGISRRCVCNSTIRCSGNRLVSFAARMATAAHLPSLGEPLHRASDDP